MNPPSQGLRICPVCALSGPDVAATYSDPWVEVRCPNCLTYRLSRSADNMLAGPGFSSLERAVMAYRLRRRSPDAKISSEELDELRQDPKLPSFSERVSNLIVHLATTYSPGAAAELEARKLQAVIGCDSEGQALWVLKQLRTSGLLEGDDQNVAGAPRFSNASLTIQGWQRYEQLVQDGTGSRHAFMAMKFGVPKLDGFFKEVLVKAVARTGFTLRRIDGPHKTAGLIDNRMRVEIRTSRFLICDLSDGNPGAYWEAGFAEGLGRPVFYLCDVNVFKDLKSPVRPHFDTNHQSIVVYHLEQPDKAIEELVAMIRETLPDEAVMEDNRAAARGDEQR